MKTYEHTIIGFGKGGKTLAATLARKGKKVALIERSELMFGGTCINVACIPSKSIEHNSRLAKTLDGDFSQKAAFYRHSIAEKRNLTAALRKANYDKLASAGVDVIVGEASFLDEHTLQVLLPDGTKTQLFSDNIYINTGAAPFIPPIQGLRESAFVYTSEQMMELDTLPKNLVIIGGGYIGLEFASYYTNFGSKVTVIQDGEIFIPKEDAEVADVVLQSMEKRGIIVLKKAQVLSIADTEDSASLQVETADGTQTLIAQAVLVATGRRPNVAGLALSNAGVNLTSRGAVETDETLRTSVPHIWAMGDVVGGLQFTYISLDDSRIVKSQILEDGSRTTANRKNVPYSVFIDPPLSRVGLTEQEALERGYSVTVARLAAAAIPKAKVVKQQDGILKVIVDAETDLILGAHLFCAESYEMINLLKLAMDASIPYTALRDMIYTHPTMSESFNDLFASI